MRSRGYARLQRLGCHAIGNGDLLVSFAPGILEIIGVGDAWLRAMHRGVADTNPYDGIELLAHDGYHASVYGSCLEALMICGSVTSTDTRVFGAAECSGFEFGLSSAQFSALE